MKCSKCNNEIDENNAFCPFCGSPVEKEEPVAKESEEVVEAPVQEKVEEPVVETKEPIVETKENVEEVVSNEIKKVNVVKTEKEEETKKETVKPASGNRHSVITIAILAVVAVLAVVSIILLVVLSSKDAEGLYKSAIKSAINELYVGEAATADSANLTTSVEISTNNAQIKDFVDGLKATANIQYDLDKNQYVVGLDLSKKSDSYLAASVMADIANNQVFVKENNLYDKVVKVEIPDEYKETVDEYAGEVSNADKVATKKAANKISSAINDNLSKDLFKTQKVTVNISGKDKKVKDNTVTMTMQQFCDVVKNTAKTLRMDNSFLDLYEDRNSVVSALDSLEDYVDDAIESMEGTAEDVTITVHYYTSGLGNKFVGAAVVFSAGYNEAYLEIINTAKNTYEINFKGVAYGSTQELGSATVVVNKSTKKEKDITVSAEIEDFGKISVNFVTSSVYNKGITAMDTANAIDVESMSQDDLETIYDNFTNSKLYELLEDNFGDLSDYFNIGGLDTPDDSSVSTDKKLPKGVTLKNNQYYVLTYDDDAILYNVPSSLKMYADDENYVLYSKEDKDYNRADVDVTAYLDFDEVEEDIKDRYDSLSEETDYYKNVKLSDTKTVKVGDYTFTTAILTYESSYGDKYEEKYYYTKISDDYAYYLTVENSEDMSITESEIKDLLTLDVHLAK